MAEPIRQALEERRRDWRVVFDLKAPFAGLDSVVAGGDARIQGAVLVSSARPETPGGPNVFTRAACEGNVKLEAQFAASWRSSRLIGLALNATRGGGYAFLVTVAGSIEPVTAIAPVAISNPSSMAPESPIKIFAGRQLWGKKPATRPSTIAAKRPAVEK